MEIQEAEPLTVAQGNREVFEIVVAQRQVFKLSKPADGWREGGNFCLVEFQSLHIRHGP